MTEIDGPQSRTVPSRAPALDVYHLESVEQLKVLADPIRYRMMLLLEKPRTAAGLGRAMGLSRAKAHYHLKQLESVGLAVPDAEILKNGIVEKYYIAVGRMLNFGRLIPPEGSILPGNVSAETFGAISSFLAAMLDVSRENARSLTSGERLKKGYFFDFEATLTNAQYGDIRTRLAAIGDEIVAQSRANLDPTNPSEDDLVSFRITNYLATSSDPVPDDDIED